MFHLDESFLIGGRSGLARRGSLWRCGMFFADLSITAASVVPTTGYTKDTGIAGATITAGQTVYKDSTDSDKLKLADANATTATATVVGIALHAAASGQPLTIITGGILNPGATVTVGTIYVVSATAGGIAPSTDLVTGWYVGILGVGITSSTIRIGLNMSGVAVP